MMAVHPRPETPPDALLDEWGGEVFRRVLLPSERAYPAGTIAFGLLHRDYGVALIDLAPDEVPDAVVRFRSAYRLLDPAGSTPPPVVYLSLSGADFWRLTILLDSAFALESPPDAGRDGWVAQARALLVCRPDGPERVDEVAASAPEVTPPLPVAPAAALEVMAKTSEAERPAGARRRASWLLLPLVLAGAAVLLMQSGVLGPWLASPGPVSAVIAGLDQAPLARAGEAETAPALIQAEAEQPPSELPAQPPDMAVAEADDTAPGAAPPAFVPPPPLQSGGAIVALALPLPGPILPAAEPSPPQLVPALAEGPASAPQPEAPPAPPDLALGPPPPLPSLAETPAGLPPADPVPLAAGPPVPLAVSWLLGPVPTRPPLPSEMASLPLPQGLSWPEPPPLAEPAEVPDAPAAGTAPTAPPVVANTPPDEPLRAEAPMEPPPAPAPVAAARPSVAPELLQALVRRGHSMLAIGDVSAARLLYERAASAGSGAAATAMGRTYDPAILAGLGVRGLRPDPALAGSWYRRGEALGDAEARVSLQRLLPGSQQRAAE